MSNVTLRIDNERRVKLPTWWCEHSEVGPSTDLLVAIDASGALILETRAQGLRRARALVRKYIPVDRVLSDELMLERRNEA
jgi:hypothetical protein